jgi:parallel beta-helix repeat protein
MREIDHYNLRLTWEKLDGATETSGEQDTTGSVGGAPIQQEITCGSNVTGTVTLRENLDCTTDGLIVADEATTINLNGFSIFGPGMGSSRVGIGIDKDGVAIKGPGIISGFQAGILATGTNQPNITSTILQNNQIGIFLTGTNGVHIIENIVKNNNIGIAARSDSSITAQNNLIDNNTLGGITFVDATTSNLISNNIGGSQNGIFLDPQSSENTVRLNSLLRNEVDINNANGLAPTVNQNAYSNNRCQTSIPSGLCSNAP